MLYLTLGTGLLLAAILAQKSWHRITPIRLALPVLAARVALMCARRAGNRRTCVTGDVDPARYLQFR